MKDLQILSLNRDLQALWAAVQPPMWVNSSVVMPIVSPDPVSSNVKIYFDFFEKYLNNLEYLEILHPRLKQPKEGGDQDTKGKKFDKGTNLVNLAKNQGGDQKKPTFNKDKKKPSKFCYLCKEKDAHYTPFCKKPMSVKAKMEIFVKHGLCFNCGRRGHSANACKAPPACGECRLRHLSLLHYTPQGAGQGGD